MINRQLINPGSILVVGGSDNTNKPGGKIIENLLKSPFKGELSIVNPKADEIQGLKSYRKLEDAPFADLAILAIAARFCPDAIRLLTQKGTRAFIILSAGFGELDEAGKLYEQQILKTVTDTHASLLGPNCIGMINPYHHSAFTTPIPKLNPTGIDFVSSSGSTAVFIIEAGMGLGLQFSSVYSVGNALQINVEDVLEYMDNSFDSVHSSKVKMIYIENISDPIRFLKHSRSLIEKGAKIIALKAGMTQAGSRAAASHTGAMASPSDAVKALFKKAGVFQCSSREELMYAGIVLQLGISSGKNIAVITHAGGAGVLLTDALEGGGMSVPKLEGPKAEELLSKLYSGSSVSNPIDFLATGTAEQLGVIIDYCNDHFDEIDALAVIFGSPGLFDVRDVYKLLSEKMKRSPKPIYPILPSPVNTEAAIDSFIEGGNMFLPDESVFGQVLSKLHTGPKRYNNQPGKITLDEKTIRTVIETSSPGFMPPESVLALLKAANIPVVEEIYADTEETLMKQLNRISFPIVMKAIGPVHKSDMGGVILGINTIDEAKSALATLMSLPEVKRTLIQKMIAGTELFIGAKKEGNFGQLMLLGLGGIYLEVLKDVQTLLLPVTRNEIVDTVASLKSFPILRGIRGQQGIPLESFYDIIEKFAALIQLAPGITEIDLNPLIANEQGIWVVDARIKQDINS